LGVTQFEKGGNSRNSSVAPFPKSGRAIRDTSVDSFYPSRTHAIQEHLSFDKNLGIKKYEFNN
jgi:hypothetical protein